MEEIGYDIIYYFTEENYYMGNVNYDSFYKFLVSLGIILVILPFTVFVFLVTNSFDLQISEADLITYTETAQEVIRWRQAIPLLFHKKLILCIIAICIIGGVVLIIYGLIKWHELQKLDDICKRREAEKQMEAIEKNIVEMSDDQIIQKTTFDEGPSANVMKGFLIEQKYFNLVKSIRNTHTVKNNIMIGNCEYDIVAFSNKFFEKDFVYEVKYLRNNISLNRIEKCRENMKKLRANFSDKLNRIPYMILTIVVPDEMFERTLNIVNQMEKWNNYSVEVMKESDLLGN